MFVSNTQTALHNTEYTVAFNFFKQQSKKKHLWIHKTITRTQNKPSTEQRRHQEPCLTVINIVIVARCVAWREDKCSGVKFVHSRSLDSSEQKDLRVDFCLFCQSREFVMNPGLSVKLMWSEPCLGAHKFVFILVTVLGAEIPGTVSVSNSF